MKSNILFADLILFVLILIIFVILGGGLFFLCRAVFFKARNVPNRHLKHWVPAVLSGIRPSRSSEMILADSSGIGGGDGTDNLNLKENSYRTITTTTATDDSEILAENRTSDPNVKYFIDRVSARTNPDGTWDQAQIGLLSTFSTGGGNRSTDFSSSNITVLEDYSTPPTIVPTVHDF